MRTAPKMKILGMGRPRKLSATDDRYNEIGINSSQCRFSRVLLHCFGFEEVNRSKGAGGNGVAT